MFGVLSGGVLHSISAFNSKGMFDLWAPYCETLEHVFLQVLAFVDWVRGLVPT